MSNYLSNLVARNLNQMKVIQPRFTSLFESGSLNNELIQERKFDLENLPISSNYYENENNHLPFSQSLVKPSSDKLDNSRVNEADLTASSNITNQNQKALHDDRKLHFLSMDEQKSDFKHGNLARNESKSKNSSNQLHVPEIHTSSHLKSMSIAPKLITDSSTRKVPPKILNQEIPTTFSIERNEKNLLNKSGLGFETDQQSMYEADTIKSTTEQISSLEKSQDDIFSQVKSDSFKSTHFPEKIVVHPEITQKPKTEKMTVEPIKPEGPIVRLTIGKIEVKAVKPPTPTISHTAPVRSAPTLSLEDYLKQRNGEP